MHTYNGKDDKKKVRPIVAGCLRSHSTVEKILGNEIIISETINSTFCRQGIFEFMMAVKEASTVRNFIDGKVTLTS